MAESNNQRNNHKKPTGQKPGLANVKKALANRPAKSAAKNPTQGVAAAATKPRKNNPRTAKSRDARAKARGRVPIGTTWTSDWNGKEFSGSMTVWTIDESKSVIQQQVVKRFDNYADGHFRLMEELDIKFWNWFTAEATAEEKSLLVFAQSPPAPAPFAFPSEPGGKDGQSHGTVG